MLEYARRHGLGFNVPESCRSKYDGKAKFNFADITDDHLADEQSLSRLQKVATRLVLNYLEMKTGADLSLGSPISLEWKHMLVIWSTEDADEKYGIYRCLGIWEKLKTFIDAAMNECLPEGCEGRTSLQWWWSREKTIVRPYLSDSSSTNVDSQSHSVSDNTRSNCISVISLLPRQL